MQCIRASDGVGLPSVVRIPGGSFSRIGTVLDMGATGIMLPTIESREQLETAIAEFHFPPKGRRSFGGSRVYSLFGEDYCEKSKTYHLLAAQIENVEGLENVEEIAAAEGVDILFFGPSDMRLSMGLPLETPLDHPKLMDAMRRIASTAKGKRKVVGTVALTAKNLRVVLELGFTFIVSYVDIIALEQTAIERFREMRKLIEGS